MRLWLGRRSHVQALILNTSACDAWRRLPRDSAMSSAAIRPPGSSPEPPRPGWSPLPSLADLQICRRRATDSLSKAIYVSEQLCIRWHSTGAYYTAKLTFSHDFSSKFGVRIIQVCVLYSNFYSTNFIKLLPTITICNSDRKNIPHTMVAPPTRPALAIWAGKWYWIKQSASPQIMLSNSFRPDTFSTITSNMCSTAQRTLTRHAYTTNLARLLILHNGSTNESHTQQVSIATIAVSSVSSDGKWQSTADLFHSAILVLYARWYLDSQPQHPIIT